MKILHILREEPDATIKDIVASTTNGDQSKTTELYSGAIEEKFLVSKVRNMREFHQGLSWTVVDKKLDHLGLDHPRRTRIEADISQMVSRPDQDWALWGGCVYSTVRPLEAASKPHLRPNGCVAPRI